MKKYQLRASEMMYTLICDTNHKAESILQVDFPYPTISLEKLLHVSLPGMWAQTANEDTTATHIVTCKKRRNKMYT